MDYKQRITLFNGFTIDVDRGCVVRAGEQIHLRPQTYQVLKYLAENRGRLISKDKLIEEVWKGRAVTDGSLGKCIQEMRDALGPEANHFIRNVHARGYILEHGIEETVENKLPSIREDQLEVVRVTIEDNEELPDVAAPEFIRAIAARSPVSKKASIVGAGILVLIITGFVVYRVFPSRSASSPIESIAVLPLVNESGNSDVEYLSDGVTESLINSLSQLASLAVKARGSVFRYKGKTMDPRQAASELSVQAIVTGRLVQRGDDLTLYLSLVDGRNGNQLWGERYDRKLTDLVTLQNEIARDVSRKLRARLSGADEQRIARNYTENAQAYQLYLRGRYQVLKQKRSQTEKGVEYFQQAIALDQSYALAYVGLAEAFRALALSGELSPTEYMPRAKAAAQRAVSIDNSLAEAHSALAFIVMWYDWDWNESEKQCKVALELNPNSADSHLVYAHLLSNTGRHAEAIAEAKRARELDPLNLRTNTLEGEFLIHAGQTAEALDRLQKVFELDSTYWFAHVFASSAYIEKGDFAEAVVEAQKARDFSEGNAQPFAFQCYALMKLGKKTEARAVLQELLKRSTERNVPPYYIALSYWSLGQRDDAIAWLERGYEQRDPRMTFLKVEPKWNSLRGDSRFQDLIRRVGFQP